MHIFGGGLGRGLLGTMLVSAGSALVGVGSAGAAITQTAITSPSSPFIYQFNTALTPAPTVTITGATNSTAPGSDTVDIGCYYNRQSGSVSPSLNRRTIATNVALNPDGTFSTGPIQVNQDGYTCQLRAVPHNYGNNFPQSPFTGVFSELDRLNTSFVSVVPGSAAYDFFYSATSTSAYDDYDSVGGCGLDYSYPINPINNSSINSAGTWSCAGALYNNNGSGTRTEILIDGKNAYNSESAKVAYSDGVLNQNSGQAAGFPALSSSYVKDPVSGNVTIHESEGLVSCADASYPATQAKCGGVAGTSLGSWQSDGVSFSRLITQTTGGQVVKMTDTYSSTDGHAHSLDLQYDNYADENGNPVWQLPGTSSFQGYTQEDRSVLSGNSTDVIYTRDGVNPDGSGYDGPGALIYNTQPNYATFANSQRLLLDYQRTVPAGGSITITNSFVTGIDQATTQRLANTVVDQSVKPTVSITSPANATVSPQSSVQVSGQASAHDSLALKVNGAAVGVNPDGTWSTDLALNQGANTITAVAADGSGNTTQATETVYYAAVIQKFCVVPNVSRTRLSHAKAALRGAGCSVGHISKVRSRSFGKGVVEHAAFSAGVLLKYGSSVGLTESIGKPKPKHHKKHHKKHRAHHRH